VERVLVRVLSKGAASRPLSAARLKTVAMRMLDTRSPGTFNQAMMELGATVCLPKSPLCVGCPVWEFCQTRGEHATRPGKQMRSREISYALVRKPLAGSKSGVQVLLTQRPAEMSQMPGMWELPLFPASKIAGQEPVLRLRHSITNTNYYAEVYELSAEETPALLESWHLNWVSSRDLGEIALTGLARKILMRLEVFARPTRVRRGKALPGAESVFL